MDQLDFPPVRNGVDYLLSVVELLGQDEISGPPPRHVKYAVLHLQAAAEVLLKARLLREHWSLVFKDPGQASERRFLDGDFESCGVDDTVRRLRQIVGLTITDQDHRVLKDLAKDRNALQHYGLTHNVHAIESRAGNVLDFLVRFLDEALLPGLTEDEENAIGPDMDIVREELAHIEAFVVQRWKRVHGELQANGLASRAVHCPECHAMALVVKADSNHCHYCGAEWPNAHVLARAATTYLEPGEAPMTCGVCQEQTVSEEVNFLDDPAALYLFCYSCTARVPDPTFQDSLAASDKDTPS
jgi:hypothetical protein